MGGGLRSKLDVQGQGAGRILDVDGQGVVEGLKNRIIFMNVIYVSSLSVLFDIIIYLVRQNFDIFVIKMLL